MHREVTPGHCRPAQLDERQFRIGFRLVF